MEALGPGSEAMAVVRGWRAPVGGSGKKGGQDVGPLVFRPALPLGCSLEHLQVGLLVIRSEFGEAAGRCGGRGVAHCLLGEQKHCLSEKGEDLAGVSLGLELLLTAWRVGGYSAVVRRGIRLRAFSTICGDPVPQMSRTHSRYHTQCPFKAFSAFYSKGKGEIKENVNHTAGSVSHGRIGSSIRPGPQLDRIGWSMFWANVSTFPSGPGQALI